MVLRLTERGLETVFGRLCQDLFDGALRAADEQILVSLYMQRLELWKRLFLQGSDGLLPPHKIKGLIGELLALEEMITSKRRAPIEAVTGWVGPGRSDQDFLFDEEAVEVKAIAPDATTVSISSIEQLDARIPTCLLIYRLRLAAATDSGAINLNTISTRIEGLVSLNTDALRMFNTKLLEAGYVEHEKYDLTHYVVFSRTAFDVQPDFPKLSRNNVPLGVVNSVYTLDLNQLDRFARRG